MLLFQFLGLCLGSSIFFGGVLVSLLFVFWRYDSVLTFRSCAIAPVLLSRDVGRGEKGKVSFSGAKSGTGSLGFLSV